MHSAPSVSYPVGRSLFSGVLATVLWFLAAVILLLWSMAPVPLGWRQWAAAAVLLVSGVGALSTWRRFRPGELCWDGQAWSWSGAPAGGSLHVVLDLQRRMLVEWRAADGGRLWLWLERASRPGRWADLRRAVYSRASPEATHGIPSHAANP